MRSRIANRRVRPASAAARVLRRLGHRLDLLEWSSRFKRYLGQNPLFDQVLRTIVRCGCEEEAVLEFLFSECYERPLDTPWVRPGLRKIFKDAGTLSAELKLIARRVREMNQFILSGLDREENFFLVRQSNTVTIPVPVQHFDYLPTLLEYYSSRLETVIEKPPDANKIELQGPEIAVLAVYVKAVTGRSPYPHVTDLLQAAYESVGLEFEAGCDAIAKRVDRYKKDHPHTFARIEELVESHVAGVKKGTGAKTDFALLIYENLYATNDPRVDDIVRRP